MKTVIKLSGKSHAVWVKWDLILHQYGNLTLEQYMEATTK